MNFSIDDPLAGILSDGSDDSFFDDDILGKKKTQKKGITTDKKNTLFDLDEIKGSKKTLAESESKKDSLTFDIIKPEQKVNARPTASSEKEKNSEVNNLNVKPVQDTKDITKSPSKDRFSKGIDNQDILDLTLDSKKSTKSQVKTKNSLLMDDILGSNIESSNKKITSASKSQEFNFDAILGKSENKPLSFNNKDSQKQSLKVENAKEIVHSKNTKSNSDWLGIFKDSKHDNSDEEENDMPSWLSGNESKKKKEVKEPESKKAEPKKEKVIHRTEAELDLPKEENIENIQEIPNIAQPVDIKTIQSTSNIDTGPADITMESAALYLQQQESQLMVALQLKAQDDKLAALQMKQQESERVKREAAVAHHEHLDAMLRKQAEHRREMQNVIAVHQERITHRIKALLGTSNMGVDNTDAAGADNFGNTSDAKDTPQSKERAQLLQLVQSLQENHDKEIDLMENSYRRQLAFIEVCFNQAEERMKEESDKLVKFYTEKINWLDEHHQLYKKMAEDNLRSLVERHKTENDMIRQQHTENIKVLQEHHGALMENVKNAISQEQVLIKDSAGFSTELNELLLNVKKNNAKAEQFYDNLDTLTKNTQRDTERSLQARETQITDMLQQLKLDRENFEKDKSENKEMVKMLETRLRHMTTTMEEESALLRQKKMDFEFEKATFSKQTEFAKNVLKKQDEDFKILKEEMLKEFQEKNEKVNEEKAKAFKESALIAKEKASIQNLKLELEKTKAELQAQLEELAEERAKMNNEKQEMHIEEQRIRSKSRDLDLLAKSAIDKQAQAEKKYSEAEFSQNKYEDRIRRIQEHVVSLNAREKQIAKEKVALSRERLSLHNERKEMEGRLQCSLCRSTQYNVEPYYVVPQATAHTPASRDYGNRTSINFVEQEMAELMSRINQRQNGVGSLHDPEIKIDDHLPNTTADATSGHFKDYMDPKFMMLRLDVQQVISNLDQNKNMHGDENEDGA